MSESKQSESREAEQESCFPRIHNYPQPLRLAEGFEPMKLIAVTERLRAWSKGNFGPTLAQVREDIKWLLDSHLYYYQKTQELDKAYWGAGCKEAPMSWRDRAEEAEKKLKKIEEIFKNEIQETGY